MKARALALGAACAMALTLGTGTAASASVVAKPKTPKVTGFQHGFIEATQLGKGTVPVRTIYVQPPGPTQAIYFELQRSTNGGTYKSVDTVTRKDPSVKLPDPLFAVTDSLKLGSKVQYKVLETTADMKGVTVLSWRFTPSLVEDTSKAITYPVDATHSPWKLIKGKQFTGGTAHITNDSNHATFKFTGFAAGLVGSRLVTPKGVDSGVALDGGKIRWLDDSYALLKMPSDQNVVWSSARDGKIANGSHTAEVTQYDGTANVDAFVVLSKS